MVMLLVVLRRGLYQMPEKKLFAALVVVYGQADPLNGHGDLVTDGLIREGKLFGNGGGGEVSIPVKQEDLAHAGGHAVDGGTDHLIEFLQFVFIAGKCTGGEDLCIITLPYGTEAVKVYDLVA